VTSLLYFGPQWVGSTSLQRFEAFRNLEGLRAIGVDNGSSIGGVSSLWHRIRWKLRLPVDSRSENQRLIEAVNAHRPQIVLVDNSKVILRKTLTQLRALGVERLVYYSPDDIVAKHNLSLFLKWSFPEWDMVVTTKTFNVAELAALKVRRPFLIGKAFDAGLHLPKTPAQVGADFERFDAVFLGAFERERGASINALAESGVSIVVYGADKGNWRRSFLHPSIELRNSAFGEEYVCAWHTGKVALCFLRKINRDRITQRTMELAAIGRPMVAERTDEHDAHFTHGKEYLGFRDDGEMVEHVRSLLADDRRRRELGISARNRCLTSGYSTVDRARQLVEAFLE